MATHTGARRAGRSPLIFFAMLSYLMMIPGVLAMNFVSRAEWKARAPKEAYKPMTDAKGVKVHYLGPQFSGKQHSECDDFMRSVQNQHMDESPEDYFDIAYNLAVCEHGYVFDGRGKGHRSGANGDVQLNSDHYAVLAFLGKSGVTEPTKEQIIGLQDSIAYLRRAGAGDEIKGHRDGYNTECPGGPLYKLVTDGSLDPGKLWDGGSHTVQKGEDLDTISAKYNVPKQYIITANDLQSPYRPTVNQTIEVPARGVPLTESGN
ncbi:N-acetylmuramoyl-L-alanine amidase [Aspergillus flavus]|nr:N-acetylmuramoyl-L-alanine amidase [Aspergillus flavus]